MLPAMDEALLSFLRATLPSELVDSLSQHLEYLRNGQFQQLLENPHASLLTGHTTLDAQEAPYQSSTVWSDYVFHRLGLILGKRKASDTDSIEESPLYKQHVCFLLGYAALLAFLQSNATGPPLAFSSAQTLFPSHIAQDSKGLANVRSDLIASLGIDGVAAYRLTPNIELLCLADTIMTSPAIQKNIPAATWVKLRISFIHQRLLSEQAPTLQGQIYDDLDVVDALLSEHHDALRPEYLLERSAIDIYYGLDRVARTNLDEATRVRGFTFALTGALGKRTRYQEKDTSQLVVLAKSAETTSSSGSQPAVSDTAAAPNKPVDLDLNDDTLLENISFTDKSPSAEFKDGGTIPAVLKDLDPSSQPRLESLDSITLLSLASSITNTSPADGLTREETLPYAVRVLEGGSSNWQVYTQALLVRSRIEGYKSRTIERGLLQLQALVDQVIADTSGQSDGETTSFLPRAQESESAPAQERLRYVFQLASPLRWELEAELASRWVHMGGLRSALEIYERLEMWAEAALCWAATDDDEKARNIVRRQLFHSKASSPEDNDKWEGEERQPPPPDAPRLYCILGDIDQDPAMFEKAWEVSGNRYARAQRSLGRFYFTNKDYVKAAEGYSKSLTVNRLNHSSWFALGCALLELEQFPRAVEAFSRCVQLDDQDAEAWSNLAAALLKQTSIDDDEVQNGEDGEDGNTKPADPQKSRKDALRALKRAASLKHDSYRIWENVMIVAASIRPPEYATLVAAQKRIIDVRGAKVGEKCIDVQIMELLVQDIVMASDSYDASKPGFERLLVEMVDKQIVPLITSSRPLWKLVAKLAIWRGKPSSALEAHEKAWRAVTSQPGWEAENEILWNAVVDATVELADAYESLGPREKTEGLSAGEGTLVAKDWRFKARSAVRGVMGKGKGTWEDTEGWSRLQASMESLKA